MTQLEDSSLLDFCNPAMPQDQAFYAICKALDPQLQSFTRQAQTAMILSNLNNLPVYILDFVALYHFNVDYYDTTQPKNVKLRLIKNVIQDKIDKGTAKRIIDVLTSVWGYAELIEWWMPQAQQAAFILPSITDPYTFAVNIAGINYTEAALQEAERAILSGKNVRSYFLGFLTLEYTTGNNYTGAAMGEYDYTVLTNASYRVTD